MRAVFATLLSLGLVVAFAGPSAAASKKRYYYASPSNSYGGATRRQQRNAWAYNHPGHYYEMDSNAFPVGSRGWWEMKRLEGSGRTR